MSGKPAGGAGRRTNPDRKPETLGLPKAQKPLNKYRKQQHTLAPVREDSKASKASKGSPGQTPASPANSNPYWRAAKKGGHKLAPVSTHNNGKSWKNVLANNIRPTEPEAAGQPPAPAAAPTSTGLAKSLIGNSQPRKQHMSENAVNFFKHCGYLEMFKEELKAIYTGVDTSNPPLDIRAQKQHFTQVYLVFRKMFGVMLGECRKNTIMLWKRKATLDESDVSKKKFREIIDEAAALWHAVVHEFRKTCSDLKDTFHKYNLNVFEDEGGPVHHLNYLHGDDVFCSSRFPRLPVRSAFLCGSHHVVECRRAVLQRVRGAPRCSGIRMLSI
jgi:hypothetical protein